MLLHLLPRAHAAGARARVLPRARLARAPPPRRGHCDSPIAPNARAVRVTFADKRGTATPAAGLEGENLVHLAHANGVELEGACECSLACSTCHVVLEPAAFAALEPAGEEEEDLLDLAFGLTPTCVGACARKGARFVGWLGPSLRGGVGVSISPFCAPCVPATPQLAAGLPS